MSDWNLDTLKKRLASRKEVKGWIVAQEHVHRRERYFLLDGSALAVDQDRDARSQSIQVRMFVSLPKAGRQGEITKKLFPSLALDAQLDAAIEAAQQTDHQAWDLPTSLPSNLPKLETTDPRMAEDLERTVGQATDRIRAAVEQKRPTRFNSAELFLSVHDRELHLSNGLVSRTGQSRIYAEAAYSFTRKNAKGEVESDEYLNTQWSVSLDDLSIDQLFNETADRAEHSLDTKKPATGRYPVIVDAEVLAALFNDYLVQFNAVNAYNRLPFLKPGDEMIPGATGDLLTITLDPHLEYGADTATLSDQGVTQKPLTLVSKNRVVASATDKQYADYLTSPVTTVRGNVVVAPGTLDHAGLAKQAPLVLEILQFSGLFADPNSGTFSSEIRLARMHDNVRGTVTYMKGGSLSGSITENFRGARLSNKVVKRAHFDSGSSHGRGYFGPDYALLSDVSVVG